MQHAASARIDPPVLISMNDLKGRIQEDMKTALRSGDKRKLGALRLMLASIKQREIDERIDLDDVQIVEVLQRMVKQRNDSLAQYHAAGRQDLADQENFEIETIRSYMPMPLTPQELASLVDDAIRTSGAATMKDMGKVMSALKPRVQGRTDMARLSALIKERLTAPM
jgi:uncharacterized protein YqeY